MSLAEWTATALGIACVALAARRSIWTFPTAIVSVALLGFVVFRARLYSDALLQLFFVAANLYGWRNWRRVQARSGDVPVFTLDSRARALWLGGMMLCWLAWGGAMHRWTDAALPWWDAGIAAASIAAQVLMAKRAVENWWLWIAIDVASVPLYLAKGLYAFAGLYLVYLALALWGLIDWRRAAGADWRAVPA
ncbi:MAG: nicotinamide riboside transporter PnuC [Sphingomonas phyllosphaerae]